MDTLHDDLNTPEALSVLGKLVSYMQNIPIPGIEGKYTDGTLKLIDDLLGLSLSSREDITNEQKQIIAEREKARKDQSWQKSDELRNQLKKQGIDINDTSNGPVWSRI
jgi:cysteinyl-tRNA synthetase